MSETAIPTMAQDVPKNTAIRRNFSYAFLASCFLLLYASILPVRYQAIGINAAVDRFLGMPWLDLALYQRADWVANFLTVIPLGWFGAGSIDFGRKTRHHLIISMPFLLVALISLVVCVEFIQAWFPPRTQSINDLLAGCMGAIVGPIIWLTTGRKITSLVMSFISEPNLHSRLWIGAVLFMIANLVYAVIPLDLTFSYQELHQKYNSGRLEILPQTVSLLDCLTNASLQLIRTIPLCFVLCLSRGIRTAVVICVSFALLCELVQIPIYSRTASLLDLGIAVLGVPMGVVLYKTRAALVSFFSNSQNWLFLSIISTALLFAVLAIRSGGIVQESGELQARWDLFFDWPLAKYYFQPEFQALSTLVRKSLIFGWLGICLTCWSRLASKRLGILIRCIAIVWAMALAATFEVSQVFLSSYTGDAFDIVVYLALMSFASKITTLLAE